jgi:thioesterase domain-containing protein/acyl carrier protein
MLAATLQLDAAEIDDEADFATLGLDSIGMVDVQERLERELGRRLPRVLLAGARTVAALAEALTAECGGACWRAATPPGAPAIRQARATPLRVTGSRPAGFWVPSFIGEIAWVRRLAQVLGEDTPTYALEPPEDLAAEGRDIPAIAAELAAAVRTARPGGAVVLGGYSYGGVLAFETAAQLAASGKAVERLVLLDSFAPGSEALSAALDVAEAPSLAAAVAGVLAQGWGTRGGGAVAIAPQPSDLPEPERIERLAAAVAAACTDAAPPAAEIARLLAGNLGAIRGLRGLLRDHRPDPAGRRLAVTLVRATAAPGAGTDAAGGGMPVDPLAAAAFRVDGPADHGWSRWLDTPPEVLPVATDHFGLGDPAVLAQVARRLAGGPADPARGEARRQAVLNVVRRHTVAVLDGVAPEAVTLAVSLRDYGANSIDRVEIATLAMQELDADVPRPRLAKVSNLAELVDLLVEFAPAP